MTTFCLGKTQHAFSQTERCHLSLVTSVILPHNIINQPQQQTQQLRQLNTQPESAVIGPFSLSLQHWSGSLPSQRLAFRMQLRPELTNISNSHIKMDVLWISGLRVCCRENEKTNFHITIFSGQQERHHAANIPGLWFSVYCGADKYQCWCWCIDRSILFV